MAQSNQWKVFEREVAKDLNGTRTGPTGRNTCDVSGIPVGIECKYMQRLSLQASHLTQAKKNAGDLPWILALREAKTGRRLVVMDYQFFLDLYHTKYTEEST